MTLRQRWHRLIGRSVCCVCGTHGDALHNPVRLGYTIPPSRGGTDTPDNLRPICHVDYYRTLPSDLED